MNIYTTGSLNRVVAALRAPSSFLLDIFFPEEQRHDTEEIYFDVDEDKPRLAPFVHPLVEGKIVASKGYETNVFKPAYVKDKRVHRPDRALKRAIGEAIGGTMSPEQRRAANLRRDMLDQLAMLQRRQTVMASEILRTGKVTVKGEQYPEKVVDFSRAATLTKTLTSTARWGETDVSPVDDLEDWIQAVQDESGATPGVVVMDTKAWKLLKADPKFKDSIDLRRGGSSSAELGIIVPDRNSRARWVANSGDVQIWVYNEKYIDPDDGLTKSVLPDYTVIVGDAVALEGARAFGAILDEEAGLQAMPYFSKSWVEKDPSVRLLLMQSAPLPVPYRPNATLCATVR